MDLDVVATVISPDAVRAPMSAESAAVVHVDALKEARAGDPFPAVVGTAIFGDLLRLRWDGGEIDLVVRRATFGFTSLYAPPPPVAHVPAELIPLLQRGATAFRERLIRRGDRLRLRVRAERYSASEEARFVVRDELAAIRLDEVLSFA